MFRGLFAMATLTGTAEAGVSVTGDGSPSAVAKRPRVSSDEEGTTCRPGELARGAEGVVVRASYLGRPAVRKTRFPKKYRHSVLDERLTNRRVSGESRALLRLRRAGVRVPAVYEVDVSSATIVMEEIPGVTVKNWLLDAEGKSLDKGKTVMEMVGAIVRRMHDADVVHGDLTTSNVIVQDGALGVVLIDFGLSSQSGTEEDKAVDLYVLERAVDAAHPDEAAVLNASCFDGYCAGGRGKDDAKAVFERLEDVRSRGRKRDMTG